MSLLTPFYKLKKLLLTDSPPDITQLNDNWDTIDTELNKAQVHRWDADAHTTFEDKDYWDSKAEGSHYHSASNITSGALRVIRGGTQRDTLTTDYFLRGNGTGPVKLSSPATVLSDIGAAASSHNHSASNITSGTLALARGGLGGSYNSLDEVLIAMGGALGGTGYVADLNTCHYRGLYAFNGSTKNTPVAGSYGACISIPYWAGVVSARKQLGIVHGNDKTIWQRTGLEDGTWTAWQSNV